MKLLIRSLCFFAILLIISSSSFKKDPYKILKKAKFNITFIFDLPVENEVIKKLLNMAVIQKSTLTDIKIKGLNTYIVSSQLSKDPSECCNINKGFYEQTNPEFNNCGKLKEYLDDKQYSLFIYANEVEQICTIPGIFEIHDDFNSLNQAILNKITTHKNKEDNLNILVYIPLYKTIYVPSQIVSKSTDNSYLDTCSHIDKIKILFDSDANFYEVKEKQKDIHCIYPYSYSISDNYYFICNKICGANRFSLVIKDNFNKNIVVQKYYTLNDVNEISDVSKKHPDCYIFRYKRDFNVETSEYNYYYLSIKAEDSTGKIKSLENSINEYKVEFVKCPK